MSRLALAILLVQQQGWHEMAAASVECRQRVSGGLIGLLVGDALGVPYEFHPSKSIPPADLIEYVPPMGFHRARVGVLPGTWGEGGVPRPSQVMPLGIRALSRVMRSDQRAPQRHQFPKANTSAHALAWKRKTGNDGVRLASSYAHARKPARR